MKSAKPKRVAKAADTESPVRILFIETCPSLSGNSKLTYHVGFDSDIQLRIHSNTGTGFFDKSWVAMKAILEALPAAPFTSQHLTKVINGQSLNTPGFLMAALKSEGLVQHSKAKRRRWERADPAAFLARVKPLIDGVDLSVDATPKKVGRAPTAKKSAPVTKTKVMAARMPKFAAETAAT